MGVPLEAEEAKVPCSTVSRGKEGAYPKVAIKQIRQMVPMMDTFSMFLLDLCVEGESLTSREC